MPISESLRKFASQHNIEIIAMPWSDSCELSIEYSDHVSFTDFVNKDKKLYVVELLERAKQEGDSLSVLGPTFKDLSIDKSLFDIGGVYKKILEKFPDATPRFKESLRDYISIQVGGIINLSLRRHNDGKFSNYRFDYEDGDYRLTRSYHEYPLTGSKMWLFQELATQTSELKEIADVVRKAKELYDEFFSTPNQKLEKDLAEIKSFSQPRPIVLQHKDKSHKDKKTYGNAFFESSKNEKPHDDQVVSNTNPAGPQANINQADRP